jgi:two-component system chemotaxis response regulator CheY
MKIYLENAENECIKTIDEIKADIFGYRAILVKLSASNNKSNNLARQIIALINKLLEGNKASIFIFKDYDLLIIYQGLSTKLSENIIQSLGDVIQEDPSKILRVYDLEKSSDILKNVCTKKMEMYELEAKTKEQSESEVINEAKIAKASLQFDFDKNLLNSINERKKNNSSTKILLVEDDAFSRRLVKNVLSKNYEVIEAETGREALIKYVSQAPNIVFLDINLPDCTGMEVLERLISIDSKSYVVMLSGNSFKDNILLSVKKGAKGF